MSHFFILGLPRSRTKWFSEFFTFNDITCAHEHFSIHEKRPLIENVRGYSDTNPLTAIDYGDNPVLIIERDVQEVIDSVLSAFDKPSFVTDWRATVEKYALLYRRALDQLTPRRAWRVAFNDINNLLPSIWHFLLPDVPVDYQRINAFKNKCIKTDNRDLESSLQHTLMHYQKTSLQVERITDYAVAQYLISQCWAEISEDNAPPYIADLVNEYWIGFGMNDQIYGCYRLHQVNAATWKGHAITLKRYRKKYSIMGCRSVLQWLLNNTDCKKLITEVPDKFANVQLFLERIGFVVEGNNRQSYTKDGILWDAKLYGLTRGEIEVIV